MDKATAKINYGDKEFAHWVVSKFDELKDLFLSKQVQYGTDDPLANFRTGALLNTGTPTYTAMYDEAKAYQRKHVAHIYNHDIDGNKVTESLADIAVYCLIMMYLHDKHSKEGDI